MDKAQKPVDVFTGDSRMFDHAGLGLRLVLRHSADELTQWAVDKFMDAYQSQSQGSSLSEDNGKTLRAALAAGWVEAFTTPKGDIIEAAQVDGMRPAHVRWAATQIDRVYAKAREVPNA